MAVRNVMNHLAHRPAPVPVGGVKLRVVQTLHGGSHSCRRLRNRRNCLLSHRRRHILGLLVISNRVARVHRSSPFRIFIPPHSSADRSTRSNGAPRRESPIWLLRPEKGRTSVRSHSSFLRNLRVTGWMARECYNTPLSSIPLAWE